MLLQPSNRSMQTNSFDGIKDRWYELRQEFLKRMDRQQRDVIIMLLQSPNQGGRGLRLWMHRLLNDERPLPDSLPRELVQVYLDHSEAEPLFDCEACGLAIPVEPGWQRNEAKPQVVYFAACPCCGGAVGLHAYWSRQSQLASR